MDTPCLKINLNKIAHNAKVICGRCTDLGISVVGVTKCVLGDIRVARVLKKSGITIFGDSRLANLKELRKYFGYGQPLILLRTPMLHELPEITKICDVSMQTQIETIAHLAKICQARNTKHKIIIMIETDDKREGILFEEAYSLLKAANKYKKFIEVWGLGTNARCLSADPPSCRSLGMLVDLRDSLEEEYQMKIPVVSGGNSSLWPFIESKQIPSGINQVRIGEAIFIGNETCCYRKINDAYTDAFTLEAEVIEVKKRSQGSLKAILALGTADVYYKNITPKSFTCDIISQSSDHSVLSFHDAQDVAVGSIIKFGLNYFGVLSCMLSPYVEKTYMEK